MAKKKEIKKTWDGEATRTDSHILNRRVQAVYQLILEGHSRGSILRYGSDNEWNVSDRTVENYIKAAREMINEVSLDDAKDLLKAQINSLLHLKAKAYSKGELAVVSDAIKELNKLLGLYPEERTRHILEGKVQTQDVSTAIDWDKVPTEILVKFLEKASAV
jgi:MoxR-like ATPase